MTGTDEPAVGWLQTLGLSLYEARIYLGLLARGPQNGNELAMAAGVPSSKVYGTLSKLVRMGFVSQLKSRHGAQYIGVAPHELVERLRRKFEEPLANLEAVLPTIAENHVEATTISLSSWERIRDDALQMIGVAERSVRLSLWSELVDEFRAELASAHARGAEVFAMIYGEGTLDAGSSLQHSYREIVSNRIGGQMFTVLADSREVLIAHIPQDSDAVAIRTRNPVLCLMVEEYLHHDFVLEKTKANFTVKAWDQWWNADPTLRDLILGRAASHGALEAREP